MPKAILAHSFNVSLNEDPEGPGMYALCFQFESNGHTSPLYAIPVINPSPDALHALQQNVGAILRALSPEAAAH